MKIMIDGFYLEKPRGMGRYLQELLNSIHTVSKECDVLVTVIVPAHVREENFIFPNSIKYIKGPSLPFPIWEQIYIPYVSRLILPDLIHFPYNTTPLLANILNIPYVVTIHDLIFREISGGSMYQRVGNLYRTICSSWNSQNKCSVITPSDYYVEIIKQTLGIRARRIYTSVDFYRNVLLSKNVNPLANEYFIHVGGISPHKNTVACIEAFKLLGQSSVKLVVLGVEADSHIAMRFRSETILFPGRVDDATMVAYLRNSLAVLFPSKKEGYGMPIVEAFAFSVPAMVSNVLPMSEIAGDAALLVDPMQVQSIANGIRLLFESPQLRSDLAIKGRVRYEQEMVADSIGRQVIQTYRDTLERIKK
jgi:glycosyltransferase involved in cell wall biosynthesis